MTDDEYRSTFWAESIVGSIVSFKCCEIMDASYAVRNRVKAHSTTDTWHFYVGFRVAHIVHKLLSNSSLRPRIRS